MYHIVMERTQGPKKTKNTEHYITKTKNQEQKINIYSFCLFFDLYLTFPGKPRHKQIKYCFFATTLAQELFSWFFRRPWFPRKTPGQKIPKK